jgi:hypothetical protein
MHLVLKGLIPHHAAPAEEHGPPQRVRALMPVQAPLDPAPDRFIPIAVEQMQGLLNLANLGERLRQLVLAWIRRPACALEPRMASPRAESIRPGA